MGFHEEPRTRFRLAPRKSPLPTPTLPRLPRYHNLEPLGSGGMGIVYKARDREEGRIVALKVLRARDAEERRRFEAEIRTLSRLRHPAIVCLHDAGLEGEDLFFTMEYLDGDTLAGELGRPLPDRDGITRLLGILLEILSALEYIHGEGLLHGDLKPSNILVLRECAPAIEGAPAPGAEPAPRVKLLDFGLSRPRQLAAGLDALQGAGTPLYMAPEQIEGGRVDERSDLYSFGALLHHLIAREPPYGSIASILSRKTHPRFLTEINRASPPELSELVAALLEREPHRRPASAAEVAAALRRLLGDDSTAAAPAPRLLPPVFVGRHTERDTILAAIGRAARGEGSVLRICGEQGSGKSWLLHLGGLKSEALLDHGAVFLRAGFGSSGSLSGGLRELLREAMALVGEDSRPGDEPAPGLLELLRALGLEDGAAAPPAEGTSRPPPREQLLHAGVQLLGAAARRKPLILALEELEEASELEVEVLARLSRGLQSLPLLLLASYRSAASLNPALERWYAELDATGAAPPLVLGGFSDQELDEYVQAALSPRARASRELIALLSERTRGMPLALQRCLQSLQENGSLELREGSWRLRAEPSRGRAEAGWEEKTRALSAADSELLLAAGILDGPFTPESLAFLLGSETPDGGALAASLRSLAAAGFLIETPGGYSPAPDLEALRRIEPLFPASRARLLHRRAAELLLAPPHPSDVHLLRLARHLERGGEPEHASGVFLESGRRAARAYANRRALEAFRRAFELAPSGSRRSLAASELGELQARTGDYAGALESLRAAAEEDPSRALELSSRIGAVLQRQGDLDAAEAQFERCAREAVGPAARARACFQLGAVRFDRHDLDAARRFYVQGLALSEGGAAAEELVAACSNLGLIEKQLGRPDAAVRAFEKALALAEAAGNLFETAAILNNLGNLHRARGDAPAAVDCLRRSTQARERAGDRQGLAICLNNMARVHSFLGDFTAAEEATARALAIFEEIGDQKGVLIAQSNLGESLVLLGRMAAAREILERNLELAGRLKAARITESTLSNLARLELDCGRPQRAEEHLRRALKSMPPDRLQELRAHVLGMLAEALIEEERLEDAVDALDEVGGLDGGASRNEKAAEATSVRMRLCLARGDEEAAIAAGRELLERPAAAFERYGLARLHRELGCAYRALGPDWADRTEKHLHLALREFEAMRCPVQVAGALVETAMYWELLGEAESARELRRRAAAIRRELGLEARIGAAGSKRETT
jgi:tetratricopeptide (TPR) repeat protein/tRNA A-37 threonylcarbamoyl transferase component Bud32